MYSTGVYTNRGQPTWCARRSIWSGKRQSEVIREAVDRFIEQKSRGRREAILREAAGIWRDRTDLPELDALRRGWDRD